MLYFIFTELFLPSGAFVHCYYQDIWLLDIFVIFWSRSWRRRKIHCDSLWTRSCRRRKTNKNILNNPLGQSPWSIQVVAEVPCKKIIYSFGFYYPSLRFLNPPFPHWFHESKAQSQNFSVSNCPWIFQSGFASNFPIFGLEHLFGFPRF